MTEEISNKEKLIIIFKKTLPDRSINEVICGEDTFFISVMNFKAQYSVRVYKKRIEDNSHYSDGNLGDFYIQYNNMSEAYTNTSKDKNGNRQFVCREILTELEYNELLAYTKDILSKTGFSFGEANINSVYNSLK